MARQLKRWESPRQEGRNSKGKGGSARQRQRRKQLQMLRKKLKDVSNHPDPNGSNQSGGSSNAPPDFFGPNFGPARAGIPGSGSQNAATDRYNTPQPLE
jgi:hypothetical protein